MDIIATLGYATGAGLVVLSVIIYNAIKEYKNKKNMEQQ